MSIDLIQIKEEGIWISENVDRPIGHSIGDELRRNLASLEENGTYHIDDIRGRFRKVHGNKSTGASYYSGYIDINLHHFVATELSNVIIPLINDNIHNFQPSTEGEIKFCVVSGILKYLYNSHVEIDPELLKFHSTYESVYDALVLLLRNEAKSNQDVRPALSILKSILNQFTDLSILALIRENAIVSQQVLNIHALFENPDKLSLVDFVAYQFSPHGFRRSFGEGSLVVRCPARGTMISQIEHLDSTEEA